MRLNIGYLPLTISGVRIVASTPSTAVMGTTRHRSHRVSERDVLEFGLSPHRGCEDGLRHVDHAPAMSTKGRYAG